jgi:hypothetical protein
MSFAKSPIVTTFRCDATTCRLLGQSGLSQFVLPREELPIAGWSRSPSAVRCCFCRDTFALVARSEDIWSLHPPRGEWTHIHTARSGARSMVPSWHGIACARVYTWPILAPFLFSEVDIARVGKDLGERLIG